MRTPWAGWLAAAAAVLAGAALIIAEAADRGMRLWWLTHPLTTSTVSGLVVLLITVLVVDQVVILRQVRDRARAVAAQAAIMAAQASRSASAVRDALGHPDHRDAAADELRTYMMMLLVSAPLLIDARQSRTFLEEAQALAGELARALSPKHRGSAEATGKRLTQAAQRLRAAATPLLAPLTAAELRAAGDDDPDADTDDGAG